MSNFESKRQMEYGTRGANESDVQSVKKCPMCGAKLFSDMDVCYGCLYDFTNREDTQNKATALENLEPQQEKEEIWGSLDELWEPVSDAQKPCNKSDMANKPLKTIRLKMGEVLEIQISA